MKTNLVLGIDVSKSDLDYAELSYHPTNRQANQEGKVINAVKSIKHLLGQYDPSTILVVFEPTGTYSDKLMTCLEHLGFTFSLVNPLQSHHYAMSKGILCKNDRQAARTLAEMGLVQDLPIYQPESEENKQRKQILRAITSLEKQQRMISNQIHALIQYALPNRIVLQSYEQLLSTIEQQIKQLQKELTSTTDSEIEKNIELISSIKGIGQKTATWLLVTTDSAKNFVTAKQLIKFLGLAQSTHQSGSSVNKKGGISRRGPGKLRGNLFMAAKSAIRYNTSCKDLYQRLRAKGKPYYKAMVAVMCKLVRQFFGIIKSGKQYDENYHLKTQKV